MSADLVDFTASDTLVHGGYTMKRNDTRAMPEAIAKDLEERGLGTVGKAVKQAPTPANKMQPDPAAPAAGAKGNTPPARSTK